MQLRFDVRGSPSLSDEVRARLERLAGGRLTSDGVLVIVAQRHRTQGRNRADARERRIEGKKHRAGIKAQRRSRPNFD